MTDSRVFNRNSIMEFLSITLTDEYDLCLTNVTVMNTTSSTGRFYLRIRNGPNVFPVMGMVVGAQFTVNNNQPRIYIPCGSYVELQCLGIPVGDRLWLSTFGELVNPGEWANGY